MSEPDRTAEMLRNTFPGCEDAPLASALLHLLIEGRPVTPGMLGIAAGRDRRDVEAQLARWPNVERDADDAVVAFCGLTLRATPHRFDVRRQKLHTWCAWDALFLPAMVGVTARVRSSCPVTGRAVELVVAPDRIEHADPPDLYVSFPPLTETDTADITGTFCCHVHFLAGADAARTWRGVHAGGDVLDLDAAFELGCRTVVPLTAAAGAGGCC